MCALHVQAQERDEGSKEALYRNERIDTTMYYFDSKGRLDEEEGERRFRIMLERGEEVDYVEKYYVYTYIPAMNSSDTIKSGRSSTLFPTIFFIPGGSFTAIDTLRSSSVDLCLGKDLGELLNEEGYIAVILAKDNAYYTRTHIELDALFLNGGNGNGLPRSAKYRQYKLSLIAFMSIRGIITGKVNNAVDNYIDVDNMILSGNSAGGVLTLMYLFYDSNEIPAVFATGEGCPTSNWPSGFGPLCETNNAIRQNFWLGGSLPLPRMKGYLPMTAGIFIDYTPNLLLSNQMIDNDENLPALYFLHGTCDEIINEGVGPVPYKYRHLLSATDIRYSSNTPNDTSGKLNIIHGSEWLYEEVKNIIPSRYGRICGGGHVPHYRPKVDPTSASDINVTAGIWNACSIFGSDPINERHLLKDWISDFAAQVFNSNFFTGVEYLTPEITSSVCIDDPRQSTPIANLTVTNTSGLNYNATFSGGDNAIEYTWLISRCTNTPPLTSNSYFTTMSKTLNFLVGNRDCKVTVSVTAESECGINYSAAKSQQISSPCTCTTDALSRLGYAVEGEDLSEKGLRFKNFWLHGFGIKDERLNVAIYSSSGQLLLTKSVSLFDSNFELDLYPFFQQSMFPSGLYLISVSSRDTNAASQVFYHSK